MTRSLLDYHFLEDGELNRLWYEENDARARDAFMQRWWLGGDPVAGKDLLSHYHTLFMHRCYALGVLAEDHQGRVFRRAVSLLVAEFPADPIPKFEDVWLPFVDRAIAEAKQDLATPSGAPPAEQRKRLEDALRAQGERGTELREWIGGAALGGSEADFEARLEAVKALLVALDGDAAANHPLVRTPEPPPSKLDPSVAVPHFRAGPLFAYASQGGSLSKRENEHVDWCQPCRQRCLGALLALSRFRTLLGESGAAAGGARIPDISPEFDQILQSESPGVPVIDPTKRAKKKDESGKGKGILFIALAAAAAAAAVAAALR